MMAFRSGPTRQSFLWLGLAAAILLAVAYGTHLTFLEIDPRLDEIRRALVAVEMMIKGEYLTPTLNGEPYLNKPPLYNWLLIGLYRLFGINEFALRLPVYLGIFGFGALIYHFVSRSLSRQTALLAALFFMTNGRILIYDSLMGLIDILYSSLVYLGFMVVYYYGRREKWYALFLISYALVAAGYLMKGLPSLVFQAFALLVFFLSEKKFRILFHPAHFAGIGLLVAVLGGYYTAYFSANNLEPSQLFGRLVTESTDRTFVNSGIGFFLIHVLTYPLQFLYHYAPWSLYGLLLFRKGWLDTLKSHPFVWFNALLFGSAIFIYWLSPNIMARYLFMLLPLFFTVAAYFYVEVVPSSDRVKRAIDYTLMGILLLAGIGCLALPFIPETAHLPAVWPKSLALAILLPLIAWLALRQPGLRIIWLVFGIIIVRFGFNWFVVEQRGRFNVEQRQHVERVIELSEGRPLYYERGADVGNADGVSYHLAVKQWRILPYADAGADPRGLYITDSAYKSRRPHKVLYHWPVEWQPDLYLVDYSTR